MIIVHLPNSWPRVIAGELTESEVTLGSWAGISDTALEQYGDAVVGVYKNEVVSAYDIDSWWRHADGELKGRVVFEGDKSEKWAYLVGTPNPGTPWRRGQARPVQYLATDILVSGEVPVEAVEVGHRAVVGDFILTVVDPTHATVTVPAGSELKVLTV